MRNSYYLILLLFLPTLVMPSRLDAQCDPCGSGVDGAFHATANTTLQGGTYNYTSFTIDPGVTVRGSGTLPLVIKVSGNVDIQGTLDVSGLNGADGVTYTNGGTGAIGVAGGGNGGNGSFSASSGPIDGTAATGGGPGAYGAGWSGGGGAGHSAAGTASGGVGGAAGAAYGDVQFSSNTAGSGGGGGSGGYNCGAGGGGAGGGFIQIVCCNTLTVAATGSINANGGNGGSDGTGNCGGGGGGSGGGIWLSAPTIVVNGSVTAVGGVGGASAIAGSPYWGVGGAGATGRVRVDSQNLSGSGTTNPLAGFLGTPVQGLSVSTSITQNVTCYGGLDGSATAVAVGGTSPYTYVWCNGSSSATVVGLPVGCCSVMVVDSNGCTSVDTVCFTQPDSLSVTFQSQDVLCNGGCDGIISADVVGGTPAYSYLWSSGATTDSIDGLCAGSYNLTVVDANGCSIQQPVVISSPPALQLTVTGTDVTGPGNNGTASSSASGGTPGYTYLWSPGGETTAAIDSLAPGLYVVVVTDANGCTITDSVMVNLVNAVADMQAITAVAYPNPTAGRLQLRAHLPHAEVLGIALYDLEGKLLLQSSWEAAQDHAVALDLRHLPAGVYQLRLQAGEATATQRITIAH